MSIQASRSLLVPGHAPPPISHFGVTLLRHVAATGVRYALHQLGLSMPQRSLMTIVQLRPYFDAARVEDHLGSEPVGRLVARALLEPQGAELEPIPARLRGSIAFHRARLKLAKPPAERSSEPPHGALHDDPRAAWNLFLDDLSETLSRLNEALLAEVIASIDRRRRRGAGKEAGAVLSRQAYRYLNGTGGRLDALGSLDLRAPSWAAGAAPAEVSDAERLPDGDPRGRFREWFRIALDRLRPIYLDYAESAVQRQVIDDPDDAFFIPFEVGHDLAVDARPGWLADAIASNRSEYRAASAAAQAPPEVVLRGAQPLASLGRPSDWSLAPLAALP